MRDAKTHLSGKKYFCKRYKILEVKHIENKKRLNVLNNCISQNIIKRFLGRRVTEKLFGKRTQTSSMHQKMYK